MNENKEIQVVQKQVGELQTMVEETVVENHDQLNSVSDKIKEVKKVIKVIKFEMAKTIDPAKAIVEATKERFNPFLEDCKSAEAGLKKKAEVFMLAEKKKEDDEKEKLANKVESGYMKPETAIDKMEEVPEAQKTAKTGKSTLSMRMIKSAGAIDEEKVPEEYWIPRQLDMVKINKAVKAGIEIAGVEVKETPSMASR